mgnify:CR=1 FL=1
MNILRSYTATVQSLISTGSFVKEELRLQETWTHLQTYLLTYRQGGSKKYIKIVCRCIIKFPVQSNNQKLEGNPNLSGDIKWRSDTII